MNWQEIVADVLDLLASAKDLPLFIGGGFFAVIKSLPEMVSLLFKIRKLFIDSEHLYEVLEKIPVMAAAIREAKETGSTAALEKLFGGGHK